MTLQICVAQLNFVVGDMAGNARKIIDCAREAHARGARLVLTPELSICGYAAEDLFLRPGFIDACDDALKTIARELAGLTVLHVVVGHPEGGGVRTRSVAVTRRHNRASVLCEGQIVAHYDKRELPNYQVFDERRYFTPGEGVGVFEVAGVRVGLLLCEDAWFEEPARLARDAGGQDEVIFEGRSFALDDAGMVVARAEGFREAALDMQVERVGERAVLTASPAAVQPLPTPEAELWDALVLGVRDYLGKNGFKGAILGLSGGIDSALVLAIAVDAIGADKVHAVMMPSPYTADISWIDSRDMAERLGVRYDEIAIAPLFEGFRTALASQFAGLQEDTTEENLQARIRGTLLMALSNKTGAIVLTTGNKSEMATGYCTLYGDMAGGFAVIKDVAKTLVYRLCEWKNRQPSRRADGTSGPVIPERIITRPPSAELRPDQKDQDSLPPYEVLDAILARYMEDDGPIESIIAAGFERADVEKVTRLIKVNEYKRRQSPIGIRITHRAFGRDWRYPITSKFRA